MSKVSIIIPVYNAGKVLSYTIDSVLSQTHADWEMILVDDGSSDNSLEVARTYKDERIRLIQQRNAGAAVARNTGLTHATGKYIQFLDAGDCLSYDKIEKQVNALVNQPGKVAVCNYIKFADFDEIGKLSCPDQSAFIFDSDHPCDFLVNLWGAKGQANYIQTNSWLTPRSLIDKSGFWRSYRCPDDDGEFFARVILASEGIVYVPEVFNYYHIGEGANLLSQNKNRKYLQNVLLTIDLKNQYLLRSCNPSDTRKAMATQYLHFAVYAYPSQKLLSGLAMKRYKAIGQRAKLPLLGGKLIEAFKFLFGWRAARFIRFHLREN